MISVTTVDAGNQRALASHQKVCSFLNTNIYVFHNCMCCTAGSSDLAYETMYDDDEILDQPQTIPWFDPNYLAPKENTDVS